MKRVAFYQWMTWNMQRTKKTRTRHHMDEATALERDPESERIDATLQWREVAESDEEASAWHLRPAGKE